MFILPYLVAHNKKVLLTLNNASKPTCTHSFWKMWNILGWSASSIYSWYIHVVIVSVHVYHCVNFSLHIHNCVGTTYSHYCTVYGIFDTYNTEHITKHTVACSLWSSVLQHEEPSFNTADNYCATLKVWIVWPSPHDISWGITVRRNIKVPHLLDVWWIGLYTRNVQNSQTSTVVGLIG